MIYPRNSQKYADRIFTRFKGDISDVFFRDDGDILQKTA